MDQYKGSDVDKYRCFMSGEGEKNTTWKLGVPPNFDVVNKLFEEGRTKLDENFKIVKVEFFYDRGELLAGLMKGVGATVVDSTMGGESSACPFS
ncbi:hypothetical protein HanPSC8_Chr02g0078871 [Helianthus annuus]|nr:hypothetical protein HanPSC8_Chr02g0078871 [Helianthus annuus]